MSHAIAAVRFKSDGLVMHAEYNGTADVIRPTLYASAKERDARWRSGDWNECTCGRDEPVEYWYDYAYGYLIDTRACRHCRAITGYLSEELLPCELLDTDENPFRSAVRCEWPEWLPLPDKW